MTTSGRARLCSLVAGSLLAAGSVVAQSPAADLRVKLESPEGAAVPGALVALIDARDSVVAEGLSDERGMRILRAREGSYRVRVRRIGYQPFISLPVSLPRSGDLVLRIESPRVVLQSIVVNSKSQCKRSDRDARSLSVVWDEIDKALRASQITTSDLSGSGWAMTYHQESAADGTVISSDTSVFPITVTRPFGAVDPGRLSRDGYVIGDPTIGWSYFGPDETVLLSDQFAATHCFRLVRDPLRAHEIGVAFEPVPKRTVADITGVLWVDEATAELREIVFRYVNARPISEFDAGGFTRFRRSATGRWLVDDWRLRVPRLEMRPASYSRRFVAVGYADNGGGILSTPRDTTQRK